MAQNALPMHSEIDAQVRLIGDAHYENGRLIVGDVDVAKKMAAAMGILQGGRQFGYFTATYVKMTTEVTTSDQGFGGAFYEGSEPQAAMG